MKTAVVLGSVIVAAAIGFGIYMVDITQTEETRLPEISIDGGQLPSFDADVGSIEMTEEEVTVTVPQLEVTPPQEDEELASN
ncbi:hypothetical protein [Primorskyibacter sp. S187A]|uniref:hypothetical protein n=1 Tax=Primorskyibacter sp. S187A TaxID=3415130 RepID=UPI003C7A81FC